MVIKRFKRIDSPSFFSFESTRWWDNVESARWILQSETGQLYISQFSVAGAQDDWGTTNTFDNPLSSDWAIYNPTTDQLDFDAAAATWINPVTNPLFSNIQAVGVYIENDTPSGELTKFSLDEIRFNAVVSAPPTLAAVSFGVAASFGAAESSSPEAGLGLFSLDSVTPLFGAANAESGQIQAMRPAETSPVRSATSDNHLATAYRHASKRAAYRAFEAFHLNDSPISPDSKDAGSEDPDREDLVVEIQTLDKAFSHWNGL